MLSAAGFRSLAGGCCCLWAPCGCKPARQIHTAADSGPAAEDAASVLSAALPGTHADLEELALAAALYHNPSKSAPGARCDPGRRGWICCWKFLGLHLNCSVRRPHGSSSTAQHGTGLAAPPGSARCRLPFPTLLQRGHQAGASYQVAELKVHSPAAHSYFLCRRSDSRLQPSLSWPAWGSAARSGAWACSTSATQSLLTATSWRTSCCRSTALHCWSRGLSATCATPASAGVSRSMHACPCMLAAALALTQVLTRAHAGEAVARDRLFVARGWQPVPIAE